MSPEGPSGAVGRALGDPLLRTWTARQVRPSNRPAVRSLRDACVRSAVASKYGASDQAIKIQLLVGAPSHAGSEVRHDTTANLQQKQRTQRRQRGAVPYCPGNRAWTRSGFPDGESKK